MSSDSALPGRDALDNACRAYGLTPGNAQLLHRRSNAVWLVGDVVVRLAPDTPARRARATTSIDITRWLDAVTDEPIALTPMPGPQPVLITDAVATFWPYRPYPHQPRTADIAHLIRSLHAVKQQPSFQIPEYRPLRRLGEALDLDAARSEPVLHREDRNWLRERANELIAAYESTVFPLGRGLVHADAHTENAVHDRRGWVLIDWDNACLGPRELDLVGCLPDHFHTPPDERAEFVTAYGLDLLDWPGWTLLRDLTEYHSLGSYIRLAATTPAAAAELDRRVHSLRVGDRTTVWRAIA
ncbi:aminoglycoside phosphotransferase family protein [Nocardia sp. NPDC046763]|uniref:aminoglycoside phosphotransferase family protein n=1 Tax=Nocardia sp. NPDC046763 TaxID=3155256 RepID=UPI0033DF63F8